MSVSQEPGTIVCHVNGTTGAFIYNFGFVSSVRDFLGNYTLTVPVAMSVKADVFPMFQIIGSTGREAVGLNAAGTGIWAVTIWADAGGATAVDRDFMFKLERAIR